VPAAVHRRGRPQLLLESQAHRLGGPQLMASNGIRDRVAIVGMGCTPFGEHWGKGPDDLLIDAVTDACTSSGIPLPGVDRFWLGTMASGLSGLTLSRPLKLDYKPVTRVENFC